MYINSNTQVWMPVNIVFVLMLVSGFFALQTLGVAMVTILKNLTNIITIIGDYFMFGRTYNRYVWLSLALIVLSGFTGAMTDLAFEWKGYSWQLANCGFTALYSLMMKGAMEKVCFQFTCQYSQPKPPPYGL